MQPLFYVVGYHKERAQERGDSRGGDSTDPLVPVSRLG